MDFAAIICRDMWLLLLFIGVPALELYLLIVVGGRLGVIQTIGLIILTGMVGWMLVKSQGVSTIRRIQSKVGQGEIPAVEMVSGLCLVGAGLLLITPGFLTDAVGFLILIPPVRHLVAKLLMRRFKLRAVGMPPGMGEGFGVDPEERIRDGEVIDVPPGNVKTYVKDDQGGRWR